MSNKFKKHDLIGIPYQIIVGSKSKEDKIEFKEVNLNSELLRLNDIKARIRE
jgi:prolyl-tRNA synthetase